MSINTREEPEQTGKLGCKEEHDNKNALEDRGCSRIVKVSADEHFVESWCLHRRVCHTGGYGEGTDTCIAGQGYTTAGGDMRGRRQQTLLLAIWWEYKVKVILSETQM